MKTNRYFGAQIVFTFFLFALFSNFAWAETTECTVIKSLPYTITIQGIYCLKGNLATSMTLGNAIEITTNNVVLDLNGYKIGGLGAGAATQTNGIYASQRQNITIRNGTVRGFYVGILLVDSFPYTTSQGHLIEDIRAHMNTFAGMHVQGRGNIIRNNQVVSTGGSTISSWNHNWAHGIVVDGPGARVLNNDIIETKEQSYGDAFGVLVYDNGSGSVVENNRIGNSSLGPAISYGIYLWLSTSTDVLVSNNRVSKMTYGVFFDSSTGKYRDNLTSGVTIPFTGGTDAGNNN